MMHDWDSMQQDGSGNIRGQPKVTEDTKHKVGPDVVFHLKVQITCRGFGVTNVLSSSPPSSSATCRDIAHVT
ncbi:hypothetical protein EYF80_033571 [Liparis tanakae]|uniref:Uncharacterized protein n=1 Tax=Liparis tanakae TaxID=230148 RepID=A0A4Z2GSV8_9TELE|nr:hypothetical protein EYF80_033571 [Liparis tanakae]